jgi:hypothetical protein
LASSSLDPLSPLPAEARQFAEYRVLSGWAVWSLVLGVLSPLALVNAVLWTLPLAGMACAVVALQATGQEGVSGRRLAWFGLVASIFFFCAATTQFLASDRFRLRKAQHLAELWIDLVQEGRLNEAHQWTLSSELRVERLELLSAFYAENAEQDQKRKEYFRKAGLRELAEWGTSAQVDCISAKRTQADPSNQTFEFDYHVSQNTQAVRLSLRVIRRRYADIRLVTWRIELVDQEDDPGV